MGSCAPPSRDAQFDAQHDASDSVQTNWPRPEPLPPTDQSVDSHLDGTGICSSERALSLAYLANAPVNAPFLAGTNATLVGLGIILGGSMMAFCFNLSVYYYLMLTSALTSTIGSMSLKVVLILAAAMQDHVNDPISWVGIALATSAMAVYAWISLSEEEATKVESWGGGKGSEGGIALSASVGAGPNEWIDVQTERTPLTTSN